MGFYVVFHDKFYAAEILLSFSLLNVYILRCLSRKKIKIVLENNCFLITQKEKLDIKKNKKKIN